MTPLTKVAITTRRIIRWGVFFAVFLIVGKILFDMGYGIYMRVFPPPPPPPTVSFGKLPKLPFPEQTPVSFGYALETAEGGFPSPGTQAKVYFMPKISPNLLSLDVAKEKASSLGFSNQEQQMSQTIYRFPGRTSPSTLEINIVSGAFSVSYDLAADSSPLSVRPPAPEVAAASVRSYLSSSDLLPEDLSGPTTHEFLKLQEDRFVSALSLSESDLVKINLFRRNYDNLPSLTPNPNNANVWFIVSGARERDKQFVAAEYHYFAVDETQFSTYPVKTPQEAWNELTAGQAFIASRGLNEEGQNVVIRKIYLAYYDAGQSTEFFQPIYVLEGDKGFLAYLAAVNSEYYGE